MNPSTLFLIGTVLIWVGVTGRAAAVWKALTGASATSTGSGAAGSLPGYPKTTPPYTDGSNGDRNIPQDNGNDAGNGDGNNVQVPYPGIVVA